MADFPENPSSRCNWVVKDNGNGGGLLIGGYPYLEYRKTHLNKLIRKPIRANIFISLVEDKETEKFGDYREYVSKHRPKTIFYSIPTPDRGVTDDKPLFDMVYHAYQAVKDGKTVYVHCQGGHGRSGVFACCFLQLYYRIDHKKALERHKELHKTRKDNSHKPSPQGRRQHAQIVRYQRPLKVVVSGDRDSFLSFRHIMTRELKLLPPHSTVIHGDCKGVDQLSGEIAKELGFEVIKYPITQEEWKGFGKAAGPIRNKRMLKEDPDFILAFHPDIRYSKGTRNLITTAFVDGFKVFVCDLKVKQEFKGDLSEM
uniref:Dual specificity phosphatase / DNA processing protein n=1 Tax=Marseillevirus LCMAC101 TaxID=2506602 RepID=A0A481YSS2_9VIRU|nr:MAG: dual specificity phosphatase / DNA processing protein [Marseillevirus LCMAC101]